jgi:lysophospholipase L1-like esterase
MRTSANKITALILGILLSLVVLEVSLRVVGAVYSHRAQDARAGKREPGTIAILCFGDSFTQGFGAPPGRGYPGQLAELLQKKYPGKRVTAVINKGLSAQNTTMVLQRFDKEVDEINPDIIIILTGGANRWNAYGYGDYLNRNGWANRLNNWLYEIKIFKLARLLLFGVRDKKDRMLDEYVSSTSSIMPPDAEAWRRTGQACEREGKYDEAISWYKKIVEKYPLATGGYEGLKTVYLKTRNTEEERQVVRKLIELDPDRLQYYMPYTSILRNHSIHEEDLQFLRRYERVNPIVGDILKKVTEQQKFHREMKAWINHDIEEMIRRAHRRGIKVILQTYPYYDKGENFENLSFINEGLREIPEKDPVLFIDNQRLFDQMFLKGENKDDYFDAAKVHCNEKGYGVMAKNIYCGMVASNGIGILPGVDPAEKSKCLELQHGASPA